MANLPTVALLGFLWILQIMCCHCQIEEHFVIASRSSTTEQCQRGDTFMPTGAYCLDKPVQPSNVKGSRSAKEWSTALNMYLTKLSMLTVYTVDELVSLRQFSEKEGCGRIETNRKVVSYMCIPEGQLIEDCGTIANLTNVTSGVIRSKAYATGGEVKEINCSSTVEVQGATAIHFQVLSWITKPSNIEAQDCLNNASAIRFQSEDGLAYGLNLSCADSTWSDVVVPRTKVVIDLVALRENKCFQSYVIKFEAKNITEEEADVGCSLILQEPWGTRDKKAPNLTLIIIIVCLLLLLLLLLIVAYIVYRRCRRRNDTEDEKTSLKNGQKGHANGNEGPEQTTQVA